MRNPRVALVVVTWNSADVVGDMLRSVEASDFRGELVTVIADNASSDDTLDIVRLVAPAALIVETGRNAGYAAGVNAGIHAAGDCDAYFVLNPDIRLASDAITLLFDALTRHAAGIAVPRLEGADGSLRLSLRHAPTVTRAWGESMLGGTITGRLPWLGEMEGRVERYASSRTADWATGAAMMVSRACLDAVGEWDESYFLYSEETDFALRAKDAGFALWYEPGAVAVHHEGESNTSPALYALLVRNKVRLYRSRHSLAPSVLFSAGVFAGELLRSRGATHRAAMSALIGDDAVVAGPKG